MSLETLIFGDLLLALAIPETVTTVSLAGIPRTLVGYWGWESFHPYHLTILRETER